jgi:DNA modification methylase
MPDQYALAHPGSFDEREIVDHIELFSKPGELVFDPMVGSGTTLGACFKTRRYGAGIELYDHLIELTEQRILNVTGSPYEYGKHGLQLMQGDCREVMPKMKPEIMDLIVFSPPYFDILKNPSGERARYRRSKGLPVNYGNSPNDLGNMDDYQEFMSQMASIYSQCFKLLKKGKSMVVIVADIVKYGAFIPYHADTIYAVQAAGFRLRGIQVVMDQWKRKNIYGPPRRPYDCFHHHYALAFQK